MQVIGPCWLIVPLMPSITGTGGGGGGGGGGVVGGGGGAAVGAGGRLGLAGGEETVFVDAGVATVQTGVGATLGGGEAAAAVGLDSGPAESKGLGEGEGNVASGRCEAVVRT